MNTHRSTRIVAETPADTNCFIGFHDIIPWAADGSCVAIHRADPEFYRMEDCCKPIQICLWYPNSGEIREIDKTTGWNFQQGSRLQWLPGERDRIVFNSVQNGRAVAVIRDVLSGERVVLDGAIYAVSPDGKKSLAPDFATLAHRWKAYGYPSLADGSEIANNRENGLWELDLETGIKRLFISIARAAAFEAIPNAEPSSHFLSHVSFSPDGSRVVFLHRFFSADGALFTRMIATDREAKDLVLLAQEKVSHFDWIDNQTLLVWARFSGGGLAKARASGLLASPLIKPLVRAARKMTGKWKRQFLAEAYYKISIIDPKLRSRYGWPALDSDGHPMLARSHRWVLTDTYPNQDNQLPVILYHPERAERQDVIRFKYAPRSTDSDVKCDLHPRWDRTERFVAVDTCEAGFRQVRILDVSDIVR
jgi:hypothetical protein